MASLRSDLVLERLRVFLNSRQPTAALTGVLVGLSINLVTDATVRTTADFVAILSSRRLSSILFWGSFTVLVLVLTLRRILEWYRTRRGDEALLSELLAERVDRVILPFADGVIALGSALTLQLAPDLTEGWPLNDVEVRFSGDVFSMPPDERTAYKTYFDRNFEAKRFFTDGPKFCITRNPTSFTDTPTLVLELEKTTYSEVQYYRDCIATVESRRTKLIEDAIETNNIRFAHSLCMHAVIVTRDERILFTERSSKVSYYPNAWSASLEEQLSDKDFLHGNDGVVMRWAKRFLREELSILEEHYEERNLRALAVFLEGEILNCSLAALFKLSITANDLKQIIRNRPRADTEFLTYRFFTISEMAAELLKPSLPLHPTSQFRMLLYLNHELGAPKLARLLFHRPA